MDNGLVFSFILPISHSLRIEGIVKNHRNFMRHLLNLSADITYASLAKSFNQTLAYHDETLRRMAAMSKNRPWVTQQTEEQKKARDRMALFPDRAEVLFIAKDIWVVRSKDCSI